MSNRFVITSFIRELGVPANLQGYNLLRDALEIAVEQPDMLHKLNKCLYPQIAKKNSTLPSRVDRCFRYTVETAAIRGSEEFQRLFGVNEALPTVSEFLATLTDELREFRLTSTVDTEVAR